MNIYVVVLLHILSVIALRGSRINLSLFALDLGADLFTVGLLVSVGAIFPMMLAVSAGKTSDNIGFSIPIVFGSIGFGTGLLVPFLFPALWALFVSQIFIGIFQMYFYVTIQNVTGSLGEKADRAKHFSTLSLGSSVADFIGPVAGGVVIDYSNYAYAFLFFSLIAFIPGILFLFLAKGLQHTPKHPSAEQKKSKQRVTDLLKIPGLKGALVTSGIIMTAGNLMPLYFPVYGKLIGLSASSIGIILGFQSIAAFIVRIIMPHMVKRKGERFVLRYALFAAGCAYFLFPLLDQVFLLMTASFLLGLGMGLCHPLSTLIIYNSVPPDRTGEALGLRITINKFTQVLVPSIFGSLGTTLGVASIFIVNSFFLAAGGMINSNWQRLRKVKEGS